MTLRLEQLTRREDVHLVVNYVSLDVGTAELFVLLGPHGSGTGAVVRIAAGLLATDRGRVWLGDRDLTGLPAQQRRVGYLAQRDALFRHMTVAENVEFGLRIRKVAPAERRRTRDALLDLVGEDVVLAAAERDLTAPRLGCGQVEHATFLGGIERLQIRLPGLPGVRRIAPAAPFGADYLLVEATRSAAQARHFPLVRGDHVWVGVRQLHAIPNAGLRLLIVTCPAPAARPALTFGRQIGQLAHAQITIIEETRGADPPGWRGQPAHDRRCLRFRPFAWCEVPEPPIADVLRAVEHCPYDLVVLAAGVHDQTDLLDALLQVGEQHLLLVSSPQPTPARALICVATGEPSKQDVLVAGRLLRHLGAEVTLLAVLPRDADRAAARDRAERFLAASTRTLALLGVPARTVIRTGAVQSEIIVEMTVGSHDLLVLGAPLPGRSGRSVLAGVVGGLLSSASNHPVLLVRSPDATARAPLGRA